MIADIFNASVYILEETANSASLGGAYRVKHGLMLPEGMSSSFMDAVRNAPTYKLAVSPREEKHQVLVHMQFTLQLTVCLSRTERREGGGSFKFNTPAFDLNLVYRITGNWRGLNLANPYSEHIGKFLIWR